METNSGGRRFRAPDRSRPPETDDTGRAASSQARCRVARRVFGSLHPCNRNRLDRNGRPREAEAKYTACSQAGPTALTFASRQKPFHVPFDLGPGSQKREAARVQYNIPSPGQPFEPGPQSLPQPAPDPVSHHCPPDGSRNSEADPGTHALRPRQAKRHEAGVSNSRPLLVDFAKIGGLENPETPQNLPVHETRGHDDAGFLPDRPRPGALRKISSRNGLPVHR